ncbi:LOW QUALITY PROTEIN: PC-esterase domain-containing protein 1A-like [Xiphophorus maculatus]|uniref:LOW QUALITY PROTEIN: PC-esterase domain-containing protein 1A-like n=1 Tax=Xiphophorus maculatus TaxID=8083 RepID=UPI000C6CEE8C|nr:LOW QUALITY PROTEIN: PC-esterase domain-containing protein 1A-like [Xiphophorus maculatus]
MVTKSQARQLLHNKFVVILGGSVQRSMYKDLVVLLQTDHHLTLSQLKSKGEFSFEKDTLVEGGCLGPMTNGTKYKEVRQYRSSHHLLRYYFLTRIHSPYMKSILEDFRHGLKPDVVIVSSCVWDLTRYGLQSVAEYKENLIRFFSEIKTIACHNCLIVWVLAMLLGSKIKGGFLAPEVRVIITCFIYSMKLADFIGLDVVYLHFYFRHASTTTCQDGIHWDAVTHRRISSLLLRHVADAWGVELYSRPQQVSLHHRGGLERCQIAPHWFFQRPPPHSGLKTKTELAQFDLHNASCMKYYLYLLCRYIKIFIQVFTPELPQSCWSHRKWQHSDTLDRFQLPPPITELCCTCQCSSSCPACMLSTPDPSLQRFSSTRGRPFSTQSPQPGLQTLPCVRMLQSHQYRPQIRAERSHMGPQLRSDGRFHPHFQCDTRFLRRRWRGMVSRSHPYPHHPLRVTSRHASYGW